MSASCVVATIASCGVWRRARATLWLGTHPMGISGGTHVMCERQAYARGRLRFAECWVQ